MDLAYFILITCKLLLIKMLIFQCKKQMISCLDSSKTFHVLGLFPFFLTVMSLQLKEEALDRPIGLVTYKILNHSSTLTRIVADR